MSSKDIAEAMAYDRINPFGKERDDLRSGIIASVIANVNRSSKTKAFKPGDFMPDFSQKKKESENKQLHKKILGVMGFGDNSKSSN